MTEHLNLISKQLTHLLRMREYLEYSFTRCNDIFPISNWKTPNLEKHEKLAAFRVRFSEFQEHLGKTMRALAIEEEIDVDRFGSVLAFMEKVDVLESAERWKIIREIRNAINHEYEEDEAKLTQFFKEMLKVTPELFDIHLKLVHFCQEAYGITSERII